MRRQIKAAINALGYDVRRLLPDTYVADPQAVRRIVGAAVIKANYGCGGNLLLDGSWVNIDTFDVPSSADRRYLKMDITAAHPFPDRWFAFAFSEDTLEHLTQEQAIRFLIEAHRTLKPDGVLRLSFPGLEGVLAKHYTPPTFATAKLAMREAYKDLGHEHFFSRDELALVARQVGFSAVRFVDYGTSEHSELRGLDTRSEQIGLNIYVELTR